MSTKSGSVYILASKRNGTLYTGVTSDLPGRIRQHKEGRIVGFTKTYGVDRLVYFESHPRIADAVVRETRIKKWRRAWKLDLIESVNPEWDDLYEGILGGSGVPGPPGSPRSRG